MSPRHPKSPGSVPFNHTELISYFRKIVGGLPDKRAGRHNNKYEMEDIGLAAFSVFFMQSPSFLDFQRTMEETQSINNARTLFSVEDIPSDNHIREMLDPVSPSNLFPVFYHILRGLEQSDYLEIYRSVNDTYLVPLDGVQYFSSQNIHCENCSEKHHTNGEVTYSHSMVTPVIVAPGNKRVIPLPPEFIMPQDGHNKQDCELAAGKRLIAQNGQLLHTLGVTILGDDLYCHQPFCELLLEEKLNFIFVCKPESHTILYQLVEELEGMDAVESCVVRRKKGKRVQFDTYRFVNKVALRAGADALEVNWCEIVTTNEDGKILYKNTFATNHELSKDNVVEIVAAGRARWKIENENNNTLKTKGYHLEHNFGHGKTFLSMVLATLNILAFLFHTVLEMIDETFQELRSKLPSRKTFFDHIRALTCYVCFASWKDMLIFMLSGLEERHCPPPPGVCYVADTS